MKKLLLIAITIIAFANVHAQTPPTIYVATDGSGDYNCNGTSDQVQINQALDYVATNAGFTTVYLKGATPFIIDEPILISSNTIFTGDSLATIRLEDSTGWWTQNKPLITQTGRAGWDAYGSLPETISNVEIMGFRIDGGYQLEPSGNDYNTIIHFTYPNNIVIHDMEFFGGEWDAIRLSSLDTVHINSEIYNNTIIESGHDAISFVGVIGCNAHHNKIFRTRTNSGVRATECDSLFFHHNLIGNSLTTPNAGGYAGIQIQNENVPCTFGEINDNTIFGKYGGIHVGSVESNNSTYPTGTMKNIHVHHNKIYKSKFFVLNSNTNLDGGIVINGFDNTIIEHNVIDGGITDGIIYNGLAGGGNGYQNSIRNNIIVNNQGFGINNKLPSVNTFTVNNNLLYNNDLGSYNNASGTNDLYTDPLFAEQNLINTWYNIVATYDNATETISIYINGKLERERHFRLFGSMPTNASDFFIGTDNNLNYSFTGNMDELAVWNRAITSNEINQIYNNGVAAGITTTVPSGLQAYYKMENDWNDASGNNFNALNTTAAFTTNSLDGNFAGSFLGSGNGVEYPSTISMSNGFAISLWVNPTADLNGVQTFFIKGPVSSNNFTWLYIKNGSIIFEIGDGTNVIDVEAYFLNPWDKDYHIKSEFGRWNENNWITDAATSPCVDTGDPLTPYINEPFPNGNRVNIGVYGNTVEASKSDSLLGINSIQNKYSIVYPNPTTDFIYFKSNFKGYSYQLISVEGKIIRQGVIKNSFLNLKDVQEGVYFIRVIDFKTNENHIFNVVKNN